MNYSTDDKDLDDFSKQLSEALTENIHNFTQLFELINLCGKSFEALIFDQYTAYYGKEPTTLSSALNEMVLRDISPLINFMINVKAKRWYNNLWNVRKLVILTNKYAPEILEKIE